MSWGGAESGQSWAGVLRNLKARGMTAPMVAAGDGALGFWAAPGDVFPTTREQRWLLPPTPTSGRTRGCGPLGYSSIPDLWRNDHDPRAIFQIGKFCWNRGTPCSSARGPNRGWRQFRRSGRGPRPCSTAPKPRKRPPTNRDRVPNRSAVAARSPHPQVRVPAYIVNPSTAADVTACLTSPKPPKISAVWDQRMRGSSRRINGLIRSEAWIRSR